MPYVSSYSRVGWEGARGILSSKSIHFDILVPSMAQKFTTSDVQKIAQLANIPVSDVQAQALAQGFATTMEVVEKLQQVDVRGVEPTSQVTGLENVLRDDIVDSNRTFTQEQALANAKNVHQGFFVVDQVIDQE